MGPWWPVLAVLAAVLVGALIPALIQLRATLRAVERTLQRSGGRLDEALATTTGAARRIDALVVRLSDGGQLERLAGDLSALSHLASQVGDVVRVASAVGASVGPAVAAGLRAMREDPPPAPPPPTPFARADFRHVHPQPARRSSP